MSEQTPAPADAIPLEQRRPTPLYRWLSAILTRLEAWVRSHGSMNIRWSTRFALALVIGVGVLLLFGPVINKPLGFDDITASASSATDTWIARSFAADYALALDGSGHLRIDVTERITAFYPDDVDEAGLERVVPSEYESHDLRPTLVSATFDGAPVTVTTDAAATTTTYSIDRGTRLTGDHDIVLRYTLHDLAYAAVDESTERLEDLLEWNVFGPDFPHGVAHSELTLTVPRELLDAYSRQPRGGISWLLLGDSSQLEPDSETHETTTYRLTNEQNIPPHATFWFRMPFQAGTFTMPAPPFLYWVQVVGPFVPLLLLAVTLLFSLAARAVAWSDARGRAWYVYREEPPDDVDAGVSARVWRAVLTSPLVDALERYHRAGDVSSRRALVRAAGRTGRLGNLLLAWTRYLQDPSWRAQFHDGLRRVPRGFVRDSFIGAALAWTVLQWGLIRQLSYQVPLSVYWWPVAMVAATTVLALAVLGIALSARPLTRRGALVKEDLLGLALFVRQTQTDARTRLRDPLLPYVVMFTPARRAGRLVRGLVSDAGLKKKETAADPEFVTAGRLTVRACAVLSILIAIAVATWVPASTRNAEDDAVYSGDIAGDYGFFVTDFASDATLSESNGRLRLDVTESLTGTVTDGHRNVPQVLRQWHDQVAGHRMGLEVASVTVDGAPVEFVQERTQGQALLRTRIADEWPGEHQVVIHYALADPVAEVWQNGGWRQQLRWTALNPGWEFGWGGIDIDTQHIAVGLTVPAAVADHVLGASGWLGGGGWPDPGVRDFGAATSAGSGIHYHQDFALDEAGDWPMIDTDDGMFWVESDFVGAQLQFPEGTFASGSQSAFVGDLAVRMLPLVLPALFALIAVTGAVIGGWPRRGGRRSPPVRDVARWLTTGAASASVILFVWATIDLSGDEPEFLVPAGAALVSVAATVVAFVTTRLPKRVTRTSRSASH